MSATSGAANNANGWASTVTSGPGASSSEPFDNVGGDHGEQGLPLGQSTFDENQQWYMLHSNSLGNDSYYNTFDFQDAFTQQAPEPSNTALGGSNLQTVSTMSTLSPTTANDPFSPSDYASDAAAFGDALSDYSSVPFETNFSELRSFSDFESTFNPTSSPFQAPSQSSPHNDGRGLGPEQSASPDHLAAVSTFSTADSLSAQNGTLQQLPVQPKLVVTIDEYKDGMDEIDDSMHRRGSSKAFLSPYPDSDVSEGDTQLHHGNHVPVQVSNPVVYPPLSGRSGIQPEKRSTLNSEDIPTLDDIDNQRRLSEKKADVEDWLSTSDLNAGRSHPRSRPRAKSTNDSPHSASGELLHSDYYPYNRSVLPGPGAIINVPSEVGDEEDVHDELSDVRSPPSSVASVDDADDFPIQVSNPSGREEVSNDTNGADKRDSTFDKAMSGITANMAIMRFRQRAKDTDSASVTATLGSRRLSESDIGSVLGAAGVSKLLLKPQQTERAPVRRKSSFLENILPGRRDSSNKLKRKNSQPVEQIDPQNSGSATSPKDSQGGFAAPKRMGSFGKPKSPKIDTTVRSAASEARSPKAVASAASGAIRQIWRSRSRSDLGRSPKLGLKELMTQHGGPPMPTLASPAQGRPPTAAQTSAHHDEDSDNEDMTNADGLTMDLSVRTDMHIIPTYDGFKYQARQLNPRLADFLTERVTQEQVKRYKRLVDSKIKHTQSANAGSCSSKTFCLSSGGHSKDLPARPNNKEIDSALVGFQIMRPGMTDDDLESDGEGPTMVAAQFPSGVPLPPVDRLPAEFECPLCFKVKKFYKPSDWTKHVHEDVQPFTCTFSNCNEPKSFKRKADWVRHENERHRQLEYWVCSVQECNHTCYRKDNFVQHLVREHKVPEPKVRTGRAGGSRAPASAFDFNQGWQATVGMAGEGIEDVWDLVDKCHKDATKQPKDEPCKFCGNICTSWKKLTVHLAKHMEQISMPVLPLIEQKRATVDYLSQNPQNVAPSMPTVTKPIQDLPVFLCDEPMSFEPEPQSFLSSNQAISASMMHSYPPANMVMQGQLTGQHPELTTHVLMNGAGSSYPPPSVQSRSRGSSFNEPDMTRQQGTTYPPPGMNTRNLSPSQAHYNPTMNMLQQQQMYFQPSTSGMYMDPMSTGTTNQVYLTPASNTPASMPYSPEGSTHSLQQTYGYH